MNESAHAGTRTVLLAVHSNLVSVGTHASTSSRVYTKTHINTHNNMHKKTHARTHARTHAQTHAHAHLYEVLLVHLAFESGERLFALIRALRVHELQDERSASPEHTHVDIFST